MSVQLLPFFPPTRSGRTFFIAVALLALVGLGQLVALAVHLAKSAHRATSNPAAIVAPASTPAIAAVAPAPVLPAPTPAFRTIMAPSPEPAPQPSIALPTPAMATRSLSSLDELVEQARQLRKSGDTNTALARLRDAEAIGPENPMVIAETALTYEAMVLNDRAFEQWQRIYEMGESIGALYYMAEARMHQTPASAQAANSSGITSSDGGDGSIDNALLKITNLTLEEIADPQAEKKLALKISVKNKPGFMVDPRRVKIEARFYDLLDGKDVVITNAVTGFEWLTAPVNWANDDTEILETTYLRPKIDPALATPAPPLPTPEATPSPTPHSRHGRHGKNQPEPSPAPDQGAPAPAPTPAPVRTYFGYTVCLYYNGQLQAQEGSPARLLQQFPPPLTLPTQ